MLRNTDVVCAKNKTMHLYDDSRSLWNKDCCVCYIDLPAAVFIVVRMFKLVTDD